MGKISKIYLRLINQIEVLSPVKKIPSIKADQALLRTMIILVTPKSSQKAKDKCGILYRETNNSCLYIWI